MLGLRCVATAHDQIESLGGGRDHTVVLLMGIGTLANSAIILARGERGADCPVAVVEDGGAVGAVGGTQEPDERERV